MSLGLVRKDSNCESGEVGLNNSKSIEPINDVVVAVEVIVSESTILVVVGHGTDVLLCCIAPFCFRNNIDFLLVFLLVVTATDCNNTKGIHIGLDGNGDDDDDGTFKVAYDAVVDIVMVRSVLKKNNIPKPFTAGWCCTSMMSIELSEQ